MVATASMATARKKLQARSRSELCVVSSMTVAVCVLVCRLRRAARPAALSSPAVSVSAWLPVAAATLTTRRYRSL